MDKRQQAAFKRRALAMLRTLFNEVMDNGDNDRFGYPYTVSTKAGPLRVKIETSYRLASVFMRFEDPDQAARYLTRNDGLNEHSGKWNFHAVVEGKCNTDGVLGQFQGFLYPILTLPSVSL